MSGGVTSTNAIDTGTGATISVNGVSSPLTLTLVTSSPYSYSFDTPVELFAGTNTITVTASDGQGHSGSDSATVFADILPSAIRVELTWDTNGTDVDSHLIAPCYAMWDSFGDCYYANRNPDWDGSGGSSSGDPSLDVDDTNGYGPENIVLVAPPFDGIYQYKVHYFSGSVATTATVRIWINDVLRFDETHLLGGTGDVWDCACISWSGETGGTVTAGPCNLRTLTVTSSGCCPISVEGLPCGNPTVSADTTRTFYGITPDSTIMLTAQTGDFCEFGNWTVDGQPPDGNQTTEVNGTIIVTMDTDHTAVAACIPLYTLTVNNNSCWVVYVNGYGEVYSEGNATFVFPEDTEVTLHASDGDGIILTGWYVDGVESAPGNNTLTITMDADHDVTAVCVPVYSLQVSSQGCCPITVELPGGNQTVPGNQTETFYDIPQDTQVTLTAQLGSSCEFSDWVVDDGPTNTNQTITVTMDDDHDVTCWCTPLYTLTVISSGCCSIGVTWDDGNATVPADSSRMFSGIPQGTEVTLEAVEEGNCTFDYWDIHSFDITFESNIAYVIMDGNHTATCYSHTTYTLTVTNECCPITLAWLGGNETVSGNSTLSLPEGTVVTLSLQEGDCCLGNLTIDGNPIEDILNIPDITMYGDHTIECACLPIY